MTAYMVGLNQRSSNCTAVTSTFGKRPPKDLKHILGTRMCVLSIYDVFCRTTGPNKGQSAGVNIGSRTS